MKHNQSLRKLWKRKSLRVKVQEGNTSLESGEEAQEEVPVEGKREPPLEGAGEKKGRIKTGRGVRGQGTVTGSNNQQMKLKYFEQKVCHDYYIDG